MPDLIKHLAAGAPARFMLRRVRTLLADEVVFPFYHAVSDTPLPHLRHAYPARTVEAFRVDLEFLLKH
ncbi:MAG: hypothetical protein EHM46_05250, partial [Bacteroidetes bacterium]